MALRVALRPNFPYVSKCPLIDDPTCTMPGAHGEVIQLILEHLGYENVSYIPMDSMGWLDAPCNTTHTAVIPALRCRNVDASASTIYLMNGSLFKNLDFSIPLEDSGLGLFIPMRYPRLFSGTDLSETFSLTTWISILVLSCVWVFSNSSRLRDAIVITSLFLLPMLSTKIVDHSVKSLHTVPVVKSYKKTLKMLESGELSLIGMDVQGMNASLMERYVAKHVRKVLNSVDLKDVYKIAEIGKQLSAGKSVQPMVALAAKHQGKKLNCEERQYVYAKRLFKVYVAFGFPKSSKLKDSFNRAMGFLFDNEFPYGFVSKRKHLYHKIGTGKRFARVTDEPTKQYCDKRKPLEYRAVSFLDITSVLTMFSIAFGSCTLVLVAECLAKLCHDVVLQVEEKIIKIRTVSMNRLYPLGVNEDNYRPVK